MTNIKNYITIAIALAALVTLFVFKDDLAVSVAYAIHN